MNRKRRPAKTYSIPDFPPLPPERPELSTFFIPELDARGFAPAPAADLPSVGGIPIRTLASIPPGTIYLVKPQRPKLFREPRP